MGWLTRLRDWWQSTHGYEMLYECYQCHQATEHVWTSRHIRGQYCSPNCLNEAIAANPHARESRDISNGLVATREPIRTQQPTIHRAQREDAIIDGWVIDASAMLYWRCPACEGLTLIEPERVQMTKIEPGGFDRRARTYLEASIIIEHQPMYAHMQQCPARER
jgi:DNA-directed RNA polymerase subunit RPC12/RpoP